MPGYPQPGRDVALDPVKELLLGLPDLLALAAERGQPVVFVSYGEPPEHVLALMCTLGVRVEVRPVSAHPLATGTVTSGSLAAQDYRSSVANVFKREQNGDAAVTCPDCGTETDVSAIAHAPSCSRYVQPAEPEKKNAAAGGQSWEKGRNGQRRSTRERNAGGELSVGEMERRHEVVLDAQPTVASCAIPGCEQWRFEGTAAESRDAFAAHRAEQHPKLGKSKQTRFPKPGQSSTQAGLALEQGLGALEAMDAGQPQPKADIRPDTNTGREATDGFVVQKTPDMETGTAAGPSSRADVDGATVPVRRRGRWGQYTREEVIAKFELFVAEHGRGPCAAECDRLPQLPASKVVMRLFGSVDALLEEQGWAKWSRPLKSRAAPPAAGKWTRERIFDAMRAHHAEHGHAPSSTDWLKSSDTNPTERYVRDVFGSWAKAIAAAGLERPAENRGKWPRPSSEVPTQEERQEVPVVWAVKVNGTGLRYRTADEALVAADEIEYDGERVAREARVAGQEGKADQAVDAARALAEKIRAAASVEGSGSEPLAQQPPEDHDDAGASSPGDRLASPSPAASTVERGSGSDEAPPGGLDATTSSLIAELLRRLANAVDAGLFQNASLALIFDGLAEETRRRLKAVA